MNPKIIILKIRKAFEEAKKRGISDEELYNDLLQIFPSRIEYRQIERKSTPRQLEYARMRREELKERKEIEEKETRIKNQLKKRLERANYFCFYCRKLVKVEDTSTNKFEIIQKKHRVKKSIIISNVCPFCKRTIKMFGGYLNED